jgi:enoyl-CoA hydratase
MVDSDDPVLVEVRDQKMHITMNRPDVLNAQNQAMRVGLVDALDTLDDDDTIGVAILSGAGRAFSAGADLKELAANRERDTPVKAGRPDPSFMHFERMWNVRKPVIAAIDGYAVGGGFELAQLCDIRVATEAASFGQPEPRNVGGFAAVAVHHLSRLVPEGEAMLILMTGRPITARRAYEIGLVQRLSPDRESMLAEAEAIADEILECSGSALRRAKAIVRAAAALRVNESELVARTMGA